jgi:tryptophan-rich sensory protein
MTQELGRRDTASGQRWLLLLFWLAVVAVVGAVGSSVTLPKIPTWYAGLVKPSFTPPNAVFGPVWTALYLLMALAAWRIGRVGSPGRARAIGLFALQLALNAAWSPVFFGLEAPMAGLVIIAGLLVSLVAALVLFWKIDRWAGLLLVPYLAWVCYAAALNAAIVVLN